MILEMNPEPEDDKVLDNNFENNDGFEPDPSPCHEPNVESDIERDFDPGLIPDFEHLPRGSELRAELSQILSLANELESVSFLSEPNNTYARNRRFDLQARLSTELEKLQRYKVKLDREVLRCKKNLDRINTDSEKLSLDETRECYSEAESLQLEQYREAVSDCDAVSWAISRIQAALRSSRGGGFGVGYPFGPDLPIQPLPGHQSNPDRLGNEADELLGFGPLGGHK